MTSYYEKGRNIVKQLLDAGHQAFFVGGFVRDFILGEDASDIDITTDATPDQVQQLFEKTKATGLKFGTITVFSGRFQYEVTTYRTEGKYRNHRKPEEVQFGVSLEEDLQRRDFTINAFAMDIDQHIVDLFQGKEDLSNHLIRAIGNPDTRFSEDALRMLRAFRFVSKLGFQIEPKTFASIQKNLVLLPNIANERILTEMRKILDGKHALSALQLLVQSGFGSIYPELNQGLALIAKQMDFQLNSLEFFALCFFLNDQKIPETWRFSKKEKAIMEKIMELVDVMQDDVYNEMIIYRLGKDIPLMANQISVMLDPKNDQAREISQIYDNLPIYKTCDLVFKGQDILELTTLRNAEIIGDIIDDITYQVITNQLPNEYEALKRYTLELMETKYETR